MTFYSSLQFARDWRYAIEKDFIDDQGNPFRYAEDGKQSWGDELARLEFESSPVSAAVSHDCKYFAVSVDRDIHIFDRNFKPLSILKGHESKVSSIAFRPGASNVLVSSADGFRPGADPLAPKIIFWDLKEYRNIVPDQKEIDFLSEDAANAAADRLAGHSPLTQLKPDERQTLITAFKHSISDVLDRKNISSNLALHGRLETHFQSNIFSPSGRYMMYFPGDRPRSNGDAQCDIRIYSTEKSEDILTLAGHRDSIMWMGYNYTESLIGTVAWDKTMRIWDAETGDNKYTFHTEGQNWAGAFSPDCALFAGTCGSGSIHVYELEHGSQVFQIDFPKAGWLRTMAWTPDSRKLCIGSQNFGKVMLVDIERQEIEQERILSTEKTKLEDEKGRRFLGTYLEVYHVAYADGGNKLVHFTSGDGSAEVYDFKTGKKWRFARAGTESYADSVETAGTKQIGGYEIEVWEDMENSKLMIATIDGDAVRIWSVALTQV